jgi:hypothetical protein
MVGINFLLFVVFISLAGVGLGKISTIKESGDEAAELISDVIAALFSLMAAILFACAGGIGLFSSFAHSRC